MEHDHRHRFPLAVLQRIPLGRRVNSSEGTSWLARYGLVLILIVLVVGFSLAKPSSFATWDNFRSILDNEAVVVLLALAAMMPLIIGEFDLSVAGILGVGQALVTGLCALQGLPPVLAVPLSVIAGAVLGLVNGLIIVQFKINAFITTLASSTVMGGVVIWYTGGSPIYQGVPQSLTRIARGSVAGIPLPVVYMTVVAALLWFVLGRLPIGRRLYAVGGNRRAAELSGIRANRLVIASFIASGVLAALAGIVLGSQLGSDVPGGEGAYLLPAFAGAFLGATAIQPGRFNPVGTVIAAYTLSVAVAGLQQLGAPSWVQPVFNGTVLVVAVGLSGYATRVKAARARTRQLARIGEGSHRSSPPPAPSAAPTEDEHSEEAEVSGIRR
ncbi:MAG: transporter permease [Pseudonocardiales bacterium]|nr:transporter permease [Pseudonocardiales bacterium]